MRNIAFFTYPEWAFGAIHVALCKELYKYGINANIVDWNRQYTKDEFQQLNDVYDAFVTVPGNAIGCLQSYGIPYEKIIGVFHGRYDIQHGLTQGNDFNSFLKLGAVSPDLVEYARANGVQRDISVAYNGIHFDSFYRKPSTSLKTIGYGGAIEYVNHLDGNKDLKRGYLIKEISDYLSMPVNIVSKRTFLAMPEYYQHVDCVMVSSTEESCGLPLMEGAASGRLPISTLVGVSRDYPNAPGIILPMDPKEYVAEAIEVMDMLRGNDKIFSQLCRYAQDYARENYDWSKNILSWVELLS